MVAGTCTHESLASLFLTQLNNLIVRSAQLKTAHNLQVFALQKDVAAVLFGQFRAQSERSVRANSLQVLIRALDVGQRDEVLQILDRRLSFAVHAYVRLQLFGSLR